MTRFSWEVARVWIVELFALGNLAFLAVDIYVAHSVNEFAHKTEWIPFYFSLIAPFFIAADMLRGDVGTGRGGWIAGWSSVVVGLAGLVLHLDSQFFALWTLKGLVYTAPFVAPLSYTGIGLLLILNRLESPASFRWGQWIVFLALGGFVGNFVLALCDHAQNGFWHVTEWIPVVASAFAVGALLAALDPRVPRSFLQIAIGVMVVQMVVGMYGFWLHLEADLEASGELWDRFVHGAPIFAPLLFPNLAVLAGIGLWDLRSKRITESAP
jgi:hypothetical protein